MDNADRRILVADDDPFVRMLMVETLKDAGFNILEASGGAEACRLMDDPDDVDLVVTDLNMPDPDGIAVAEWARERHQHVRILFVSGRPDLLRACGFSWSYLAKPFKMEELASKVVEMLSRPQDQDERSAST
jgi:DNA-binding response OmpR family regulator